MLVCLFVCLFVSVQTFLLPSPLGSLNERHFCGTKYEFTLLFFPFLLFLGGLDAHGAKQALGGRGLAVGGLIELNKSTYVLRGGCVRKEKYVQC